MMQSPVARSFTTERLSAFMGTSVESRIATSTNVVDGLNKIFYEAGESATAPADQVQMFFEVGAPLARPSVSNAINNVTASAIAQNIARSFPNTFETVLPKQN
jgi:hypothetical protein